MLYLNASFSHILCFSSHFPIRKMTFIQRLIYSQHVVDASAAILRLRRATIFIFGSEISAYSFCRCINHKSALHLTFAYPHAYSSWKIARNHTHLFFVIFSRYDRLLMSHRVPIFIAIQDIDLYGRQNIERNFTSVHRNKFGIFLKRIKGNAKRGAGKLIVKSLKNASQESKDFQRQ